MIMSEVQEEEGKAELVTILECASKYKLVAGEGTLAKLFALGQGTLPDQGPAQVRGPPQESHCQTHAT